MRSVADELARQGYAIVPGFLSPEETSGLLAEFDSLLAVGRFRRAGIGHAGPGAAAGIHENIRSDRICWLDLERPTEAQAPVWRKLENLREELNRGLFLGLWSFEGHYAVYEPGTFYRRHVDQFQGDDSRVLSVVLYLNSGWTANDGGQLRLYPEGEPPVEALPEAGTLACFLSHRLEHEVLASHRQRRSLTGWYRRRNLRG